MGESCPWHDQLSNNAMGNRHSGQGYQSSWGSANIAADLLVAAQKGVYTVA